MNFARRTEEEEAGGGKAAKDRRERRGGLRSGVGGGMAGCVKIGKPGMSGGDGWGDVVLG